MYIIYKISSDDLDAGITSPKCYDTYRFYRRSYTRKTVSNFALPSHIINHICMFNLKSPDSNLVSVWQLCTSVYYFSASHVVYSFVERFFFIFHKTILFTITVWDFRLEFRSLFHLKHRLRPNYPESHPITTHTDDFRSLQ